MVSDTKFVKGFEAYDQRGNIGNVDMNLTLPEQDGGKGVGLEFLLTAIENPPVNRASLSFSLEKCVT